MATSPRFKEGLGKVVRGMSQGEIVERTGISPAYVHALVTKGVIPSREKLKQLADGLALGPTSRDRLFADAGYAPDHAPTELDQLPTPVQEVAERMRSLKPEQLALIRGIVRELAGDHNPQIGALV